MVDVFEVLAIRVAADRLDVPALVRVVQIGEARIVQLEVGAAELATVELRNANASPKIVSVRPMRPSMWSAAGVKSIVPCAL